MNSSGLARGGSPVAVRLGCASGPPRPDSVSAWVRFAAPVGAVVMPCPRSPPVVCVAAPVAHNFTEGGAVFFYNLDAILPQHFLSRLALLVSTVNLGVPIAIAASTDWP